MQQAVAVSDASKRDDHPWKYSWANLDDEGKMKSALEAMARTALETPTRRLRRRNRCAGRLRQQLTKDSADASTGCHEPAGAGG